MGGERVVVSIAAADSCVGVVYLVEVEAAVDDDLVVGTLGH